MFGRSLPLAVGLMLAAGFPPCLWAASGVTDETDGRYLPTNAEASAISVIVNKFMRKFDVPGVSIAIARHGRFVYREAFGVADRATGEKVTPLHLFRIASISKPITSVGILRLAEQGRLRLQDHVFGRDGILCFDYGASYPERVSQITVEDLLTHTSGGWQNDQRDPMFRDPKLSTAELISWTVKNQPLNYDPGTHYAYSNFGYCLLGRVVEKVTRQPYAEWIQKNVLAPGGIQDMRIAGSTFEEKAPGEVSYYSTHDDSPYLFNLPRMDSHGGWLGTPSDLVRFAVSVNGFSDAPGPLKNETIQVMTTPSKAFPYYGKGWFVNKEPNWWHSGSLPGTATILVRTSDDFCWAAFANTHEQGIDLALDQMMWEIKRSVAAWRR